MTRVRTTRVLALLLAAAAPVFADSFEAPAPADAAARLAARAKGPNYEVLSPVTSDGFLDTYRVRSDFGEWEIEGGAMLAIRLKEVEALKELSELSKTKVFTDAVAEGVKRATVGQIETLEAFAEKPVETIKGVPQGVKRAWKKYTGAANEAWSEVKESRSGEGEGGAGKGTTDKAVDAGKKYAGKYLGTSAAERRWAQKLGVDPYSSNEIMMKQIKSVAKVDAAGRFGVRFAGIPSIPGLGYVRDLNQLVWETDPLELRQRNEAFFKSIGTKPEALARFLDNSALSPTLQTLITELVKQLDGVADRWRFVEQAGAIDAESEAWAFVGGLRLLIESHRTRQPLAKALAGGAAPAAQARGGAALAGVAIDRLFWTEELAAGLERFAKVAPGAKLEVVLAGEPTPRTREELARHAVALVEGLSPKAAAEKAPAAKR